MKKIVIAVCVGLFAKCVLAQSECDLRQLKPASGQSEKIQEVQKKLSATDPCKTIPGLKAKPLSDVWGMFLASTQTGGKRLGDSAPLGSPIGKMLPGVNGVEANFSQVAAEGLRQFNLESQGARLVSLANPPARFNIPARLVRDVEYSWTLSTGRSSYSGKFSLVDADTQKEVETQLAALGKSSLDETSRLIFRAAIFDEAEMYSMRDAALQEARTRLGQ